MTTVVEELGIGLRPGEIVVDNFAGGGGASTGIEAAIRRPIDIAINHDPVAVAMHRANHPNTRHYVEDVWAVDPKEAAAGRPVGLAWFSPDCTQFSRAKGGKPVDKKIRCLAWVVIRWAKEVGPRVILLENVEEFQDWGPLDHNDMPIKDKAGETFEEWLRALTALGYTIEHRSLVAADFGAPTTRRRLFLVARRDRERLAWPEPTHGPGRSVPWRSAAEVIDWTLECPSIFGRKRPLAEATLKRVAAGIQRYVVGAKNPFLIRTDMQSGNRLRGVASVDEPLRTITSSGGLALVCPVIIKHYGGVVGHGVTRPIGTVTATDHHALATAFLVKGREGRSEEVRAFLVKYYGAGLPRSGEPFRGLVGATKGTELVMIHGEPHQIVDIGMRMLQPHELFRAQGFPDSYQIAPMYYGKPLTKTDQTRLAGNSVSPPTAEALARANLLL